jgi:multiple antibiotic resistance protein
MKFFLSVVVTYFIVVDPIALAPVFISLTSRMTSAQRAHVARRSIMVAAGIMAAFALIGHPLLGLLGISLNAFYIAGGILLFLIAIDMLFARPSRTRATPEEEVEGLSASDVSVFPLAIPIMSGPGSMATIVLFMSQAGTDPRKIGFVAIALVVALVASYVVMMASTRIMRVLRVTGVAVIGRVMGVILAAFAAQFVINGVQAVLATKH